MWHARDGGRGQSYQEACLLLCVLDLRRLALHLSSKTALVLSRNAMAVHAF